MNNKCRAIWLFSILTFLINFNNAFAQIGDIERQDQIIRNQQQIEEEERRKREFNKIKMERMQLERQKKESYEKSEKSQKLSHCFKIQAIDLIGADSLSRKQKNDIKLPFIGKCFDGKMLGELIKKTSLELIY